MGNHSRTTVLALVLLLVAAEYTSGFASRFSHKLISRTSSPLKMTEVASTASKYDTWVVGSGVLGTLIASHLQSHDVCSKVVAETRSESRRAEIEGMGVSHRIREERTEKDHGTARNVIICLPPSCSDLYADEVQEAARLWAGEEGGGSLIYTSSIGVYGEAPGCTVTENTPADDNPASISK